MHFNRGGEVSTRTREKISKAIFFFFKKLQYESRKKETVARGRHKYECFMCFLRLE